MKATIIVRSLSDRERKTLLPYVAESAYLSLAGGCPLVLRVAF
jgi:hypothetical protein